MSGSAIIAPSIGMVRWLIRRALFVLLLAVLLIIVLLRLRPSDVAAYSLTPIVDADALQLQAPARIEAGHGFEVEVFGAIDNPGVDAIELTVDNGYALRRFTTSAADGRAVVRVPPANGPESGIVRLSALQGMRAGIAEIEVIPGPAVDPHDLYLGPRTVIADGIDFTMIVAIPEDRYGNPVATGTDVSFLVTRPDLTTEVDERTTEHLLSYDRITSRTVAGRTRVAVGVDGATGREMTFLEVAGLPDPFTVQLIDPIVPADGASVVRVRTDPLTDEFGNVLPDGTDVILDVRGATGRRRLKGETIKGIAEFSVEAPSAPGEVELAATASGRIGETIVVEFANAIRDLPVATSAHQDGIELSIGPVITTRGSYVAEGTQARITTEHRSWLVPLGDGIATFVVPKTDRPIEVEVLGYRTTSTPAP